MKFKIMFSLVLSMGILTVFGQKMPPEIRLILEASNILENNYYDSTFNQKDWTAIKDKAYKSKIGSQEEAHVVIENMLKDIGDPALRLLTPLEFEVFMNEAGNEKHTGTGLTELFALDIDPISKALKVIMPLPNSPAAKAGIKTNDIIKTIDGVAVDGLFLQDAVNKLRIRTDQEITLGIEQAEKYKEFTLKGEEIEPMLEPYYKIIEYKKKKLGCVWFPQFPVASALRFLKIIEHFKKEGVQGILLDLRSNPGGLVQEASRIAGMCMGRKVMALSGSQSLQLQKMMSSEDELIKDLPMVVLVNNSTASASELLAGSLQYHKRATIIGEKTYGKGLIHSFIPLSDGALMVVSVGRLKLLNGRDILTQGIEPDIVVKNKKPFQFGQGRKDKQFKKGLKHLAKALR